MLKAQETFEQLETVPSVLKTTWQLRVSAETCIRKIKPGNILARVGEGLLRTCWEWLEAGQGQLSSVSLVGCLCSSDERTPYAYSTEGPQCVT